MGLNKRLPLSFYEKVKPTTPKDTHKDIEIIKWPKEVLDGKKEISITLPKEK